MYIVPGIAKTSALSKEAIAPLALLPIAWKVGMGLLAAHSAYSAAKNVAKGNYGMAAIDAVGAIPFAAAPGGALKALSFGARGVGRLGRVGNIGRLAGKFGKFSFNPAQRAAYKKALEAGLKLGKTQQQASQAAQAAAKAVKVTAPGRFGSVAAKLSERAGSAFNRLGAGGTRVASPVGSRAAVNNFGRAVSRPLNRAGVKMTRYGEAIQNTRVGKVFNHPATFGASMVLPEVKPNWFNGGEAQPAPQPTTMQHNG